MKQPEHLEVPAVSELNSDWVRELQTRSGKDIWLFGGSELVRSFLDFGQVDTVEVSLIPVRLGSSVPLLLPHLHSSQTPFAQPQDLSFR
jgi:dihydrofolate reductase